MWTTDDLVSYVKRKVQAPSAGFQLSDAQILEIAFEATTKKFVPPIRGIREDFFTTYETIALTNGVASYRLPKRASSTTIKQVLLVQTGAPNRAWPVPRRPVSEGWAAIGVSTTVPWSYVIEGAQIRLMGTPQDASQYEMRVYYQRRPSRYVAVSQSSVVLSITDSNTFVLSAVPAWATLSDRLDVMSPEPEADLLVQGAASDIDPTNTTVNFTGTATTSQMSVGDYVAKADTTPVILLPDAFIHLLIDATAAECMRSIGDYDAAASLDAQWASGMEMALASIAIRAEAQPLPIRNSNAGLFQRGRWYNGGWIA